MEKLSIILPSRNEAFLSKTIDDVFEHASGKIEIIAVLDGYWPTPPLKNDPRLKIIHRGKLQGLRSAINSAAQIATGDYLMRLDGHCSVSAGFDEVLAADFDEDWIVVPRRMRLDPVNWCKHANDQLPIDAHFLSNPCQQRYVCTECGWHLPSSAGNVACPQCKRTTQFVVDPSVGLHGQVWEERAQNRLDIAIDEEMSSHGSCWFMSRTHWDRIGRMDPSNLGKSAHSFQELGLKTWLSGGKVMINKKCHYLHWDKDKPRKDGDTNGERKLCTGIDCATRYWMLNQGKDRKRDLKWLVERFAPVPTWPEDIEQAFAVARRRWS